MPFFWNQGSYPHRHVWKCPKCGFTIEFNTREWAYLEIREHERNCSENIACVCRGEAGLK